MTTAQLFARYQFLRQELETAYKAASWDSSLITRIADDLVQTETALAVQGHPGPSRIHFQPRQTEPTRGYAQAAQVATAARALPAERRPTAWVAAKAG